MQHRELRELIINFSRNDFFLHNFGVQDFNLAKQNFMTETFVTIFKLTKLLYLHFSKSTNMSAELLNKISCDIFSNEFVESRFDFSPREVTSEGMHRIEVQCNGICRFCLSLASESMTRSEALKPGSVFTR